MNNNITSNQTASLNQVISFDQALLQVEGLQTKFDTTIVSASLVRAIGNYDEAILFQRLHYWLLNPDNGAIVNGTKWIWKTYEAFQQECLPGWSVWKIRQTIHSLIGKGLIEKQELHREHYGRNWMQRYVRTSYYRLIPEALVKCAQDKLKEVKSHISSSSVRSTEQFCDSPQNSTKTTTQKNTKTPPPKSPHVQNPGAEGGDNLNSSPYSDSNAARERKSSSCQTEQDLSSRADKPKPRKKESRRVVHYREKILHSKQADVDLAPWRSPQEMNLFYEALVEALPRVENAYSPKGMAKNILKDMRAGLSSTYWDDFAAGREIGATIKQEWEREPGVLFDEFIEFAIQETRGMFDNKAMEADAAAEIRVKKELRKPQEAKRLWERFKEQTVRAANKIEEMSLTGVRREAMGLPHWTNSITPELIKLAVSLDLIKSTSTVVLNAQKEKPGILEAEKDRDSSQDPETEPSKKPLADCLSSELSERRDNIKKGKFVPKLVNGFWTSTVTNKATEVSYDPIPLRDDPMSDRERAALKEYERELKERRSLQKENYEDDW